MTVRYWLVKTEPDCFAIADLARQPNQTTFWDGVRNYQARNFLRDDMQCGGQVLIHHSNAGRLCFREAITQQTRKAAFRSRL